MGVSCTCLLIGASRRGMLHGADEAKSLIKGVVPVQPVQAPDHLFFCKPKTLQVDNRSDGKSEMRRRGSALRDR